MLDPWNNLIAMIITSSLIGSLAVIVYSFLHERQSTKSREKSGINALIGELRMNKAICIYNVSFKENQTASFIQLQLFCAKNVIYEQKYIYSHLTAIDQELENYFLAVSMLSQLIDLYHFLSISPNISSGVDRGTEGRRSDLHQKIIEFCSNENYTDGYSKDKETSILSLIDTIISHISNNYR